MHWFHHHDNASAAYDELPSTPQTESLKNYLNGTISYEEALDTFCGPVEDKFMNTAKSEAVESLLIDTWKTVIAFAEATPHASENRQKLADFVIALQYRPTLMKGEHTCQLNGGKVWKDLPGFGMQMREAWNLGTAILPALENELHANRFLAASSNSDQKHQVAWINLNAWTATLTVSSQSRKLQPSDFSLYCIWTVREALEQQEQAPEVAVQTATIWFIYAAPTIWSFCQEQKSFDGKLAKPGPEFSSREWRGFEKDRWTSWEVGFKHIAGREGLDEKTGKLVKDAVTAMKAVG